MNEDGGMDEEEILRKEREEREKRMIEIKLKYE
jgi:hypothetical protein